MTLDIYNSKVSALWLFGSVWWQNEAKSLLQLRCRPSFYQSPGLSSLDSDRVFNHCPISFLKYLTVHIHLVCFLWNKRHLLSPMSWPYIVALTSGPCPVFCDTEVKVCFCNFFFESHKRPRILILITLLILRGDAAVSVYLRRALQRTKTPGTSPALTNSIFGFHKLPRVHMEESREFSTALGYADMLVAPLSLEPTMKATQT